MDPADTMRDAVYIRERKGENIETFINIGAIYLLNAPLRGT